MKITRFVHDSKEKWGALNKDTISIIKGNIFEEYEITEEKVSIDDVKLLAPCSPTKGICVGLNYKNHATEMNEELPKEPLIFMKPSSSLNNPNDNIKYPSISKNLHYEAELGIVIKKKAYKVSKDKANYYILGYTCANDVTARDLQKQDGQWTRGKSFDTFMPIGPVIETNIDPHNLDIKLYLNDEIRQSSNTKEFIFKVPEIIEFITQGMTLYPGDVILTGTPSGVGEMNIDDVVTVEIEGIGKLKNTVIKD